MYRSYFGLERCLKKHWNHKNKKLYLIDLKDYVLLGLEASIHNTIEVSSTKFYWNGICPEILSLLCKYHIDSISKHWLTEKHKMQINCFRLKNTIQSSLAYLSVQVGSFLSK